MDAIVLSGKFSVFENIKKSDASPPFLPVFNI